MSKLPDVAIEEKEVVGGPHHVPDSAEDVFELAQSRLGPLSVPGYTGMHTPRSTWCSVRISGEKVKEGKGPEETARVEFSGGRTIGRALAGRKPG